jgi:hypothetical protein
MAPNGVIALSSHVSSRAAALEQQVCSRPRPWHACAHVTPALVNGLLPLLLPRACPRALALARGGAESGRRSDAERPIFATVLLFASRVLVLAPVALVNGQAPRPLVPHRLPWRDRVGLRTPRGCRGSGATAC